MTVAERSPSAAEANGFADDRRILVKSGRPETVGENDDAGSFGTVVLRSDEAAEHGMKAHHIEIGAADDAASNSNEAHRGRSW